MFRVIASRCSTRWAHPNPDPDPDPNPNPNPDPSPNPNQVARAKLSLQPGSQGRGGLQGRAGGLQGGAGRGLQGPRAGRGADEEIDEAAEEGGGSEPPLRRLRLQVLGLGLGSGFG